MHEKMCQDSRCDKPARVGIRTTRPSRAGLKTTVHWDERIAPKTASLYCKDHGQALLVELAKAFIDEG